MLEKVDEVCALVFARESGIAKGHNNYILRNTGTIVNGLIYDHFGKTRTMEVEGDSAVCNATQGTEMTQMREDLMGVKFTAWDEKFNGVVLNDFLNDKTMDCTSESEPTAQPGSSSGSHVDGTSDANVIPTPGGAGIDQLGYAELLQTTNQDDNEKHEVKRGETVSVSETKECNIKGKNSKKHKGDKLHGCEVCGKHFGSNSDLMRHTKVHSGEREFGCVECGKMFKLKGSLTMHMKTHSQERKHACGVCEKSFVRKECLTEHLMIHRGEKPHGCSHCDARFRKKCDLVRHERSHAGEKPYGCSDCGKRFSAKKNLVAHLKKHEVDKLGQHQCTLCKAVFTNSTDYKTHITTHDSEKPHVCSECDRRYWKPGELAKHKRTHTGEKPYGCNLCGRGFNARSDLNRHMVTHEEHVTAQEDHVTTPDGHVTTREGHVTTRKGHVTTREGHVTTQEGHVTTQEGHVTTHKDHMTNESVKDKHDVDKLGQDERAVGKEVSTNSTDNKIHTATHNKIKPHVCSECDKRYWKPCELAKHKRTHTGEKPFGCSRCGRCFNAKSDLHRHMNTHFRSTTTKKAHVTTHQGHMTAHEGHMTTESVKDKRCHQCGEVFPTKRHLDDHVYATHIGNKSALLHGCSVCHEKFSQKSELVKHMKEHIGTKLFGCSKCNKMFTKKSDVVTHLKLHGEPGEGMEAEAEKSS